MEESAEAQSEESANIHYKQMEKADRDPVHAIRGRGRMPAAPAAIPQQQVSRPKSSRSCATIQECWRSRNTRVGSFYLKKGSNAAAANRLQALTDQFPYCSARADEALWEQGEAYKRMGDRFENQQAGAYSKIVKDYPPQRSRGRGQNSGSSRLKRPVPRPTRWHTLRMKYEVGEPQQARAS